MNVVAKKNTVVTKDKNQFKRQVKKYRNFYIMLLPGMILLFLLYYLPMYGILLAFKEYSFTKGILGSDWAGLKYFKEAFSDQFFIRSLYNTFVISGLKLLIGFPMPILFALLINEVRNERYKKTAQALSFLPYFVSWVVLAGIFINIFSPEGPINFINRLLGKETLIYFGDSKKFLGILIGTNVWRELGWSSIIYIAALTGIDVQLFEAAYIDGANKFKQVIHITLPCIANVIVIMLILNVGFILNAGFDQVFNMYNSSVAETAEIIDTYVYKKGLVEFNYSYGTAIGLFKSVVGLVLVLITNKIASWLGGKESTLF
jgi:putative aldouronate transport system permease protein